MANRYATAFDVVRLFPDVLTALGDPGRVVFPDSDEEPIEASDYVSLDGTAMAAVDSRRTPGGYNFRATTVALAPIDFVQAARDPLNALWSQRVYAIADGVTVALYGLTDEALTLDGDGAASEWVPAAPFALTTYLNMTRGMVGLEVFAPNAMQAHALLTCHFLSASFSALGGERGPVALAKFDTLMEQYTGSVTIMNEQLATTRFGRQFLALADSVVRPFGVA